jgi:hypothetical protein
MTDLSPTDWRALCAELNGLLEYISDINPSLCEEEINNMTSRAQAALAQPEPQGPTDEELGKLLYYEFTTSTGHGERVDAMGFARAVLARYGRPAIEPDGPAVPDGREPASVTDQPTDKELLELMPETMRDEFSYAARTCSDVMGGRVKPSIFRVALNTAALEYAHAVLARWGRPAIEPVPQQEAE